jgi:hypothetical protein
MESSSDDDDLEDSDDPDKESIEPIAVNRILNIFVDITFIFFSFSLLSITNQFHLNKLKLVNKT